MTTPQKVSLLKKYPGLVENCKRWDCGYSRAMQRMDKEKLDAYKGGED